MMVVRQGDFLTYDPLRVCARSMNPVRFYSLSTYPIFWQVEAVCRLWDAGGWFQ